MVKLLIPFVVLIAAIGAVLLTDRPLPRADYTFVQRADVSTLDLQRMSWQQDLRVADCLFEGLLNNDLFSWEIAKRPGVAERFELSDDRTTYTFHLRRDAKWSNGQPVHAGDFIYAWRRMLLPETAGDYVAMAQLVRGAKAFTDWRANALAQFAKDHPSPYPQAALDLWRTTVGTWGARSAPGEPLDTSRDFSPGRGGKFEQLVGLRAPDPHTLVVELERPVVYFTEVVAFEVMSPVYPPLLERFASIDPATATLTIDPSWTKPEHLVCNGPFTLTTWRFKRDMRLERNPHYWNRDKVHVDSMAIPSIADGNAAVLAFQTGATDWLSDVTPDYRGDMLARKRAYIREHQALYDQLKAQGHDPVAIDRRMPPDPRQNIHAFPAFGTYFFTFNCKPQLPDGRANPFSDPRVRQAFALATDKRNIAQNVRRIDEPYWGSLIPPGTLANYTPPAGLPSAPDPDAIARAQQLLIDAGFPGGKGLPTINILFNTEGGHAKISEAVKRDWEQHLGVQVQLDQKELKVFRNDRRTANFMIARGSWFGDYNDPTTFLDLFRSDDGNNDGKFNDPAFDAMLNRAAVEPDPDARLRLLEQAEDYLMTQGVPVIPVFQYHQIYLFNPHVVSGISPHPRQKQSMYLVDMLNDTQGANRPLEMPLRPAKP
jgi:oligopeptide transport system substrate-binding protein